MNEDNVLSQTKFERERERERESEEGRKGGGIEGKVTTLSVAKVI